MTRVWVFFYGTFMSAKVLRAHGVECEETFPARLRGYELSIRPRVNLAPEAESFTYGGLALVTRTDLAALYDGLEGRFGIVYKPCPVTVELRNGSSRAALCFLSPDTRDEAPDEGYIDEMAECAREMQAPESYISHIRSFSTNA